MLKRRRRTPRSAVKKAVLLGTAHHITKRVEQHAERKATWAHQVKRPGA
jgi:hypothetical protein